MNYFDFGDRKKSEEAIYRTWDELRDSLKNKEFAYNDIEKAKSKTFLKVFDDLFYKNKGFSLITKQINDIKTKIGRGTILDSKEKVDYERFIPKKEFITRDNRFSPEGVEWLYLAMDTSVNAFEVSKNEIYANLGNRFGFCEFRFDDGSLEKHIVDLTIADGHTFEEINSKLENYIQRISKQEIIKSIITGTLPCKSNILNEEDFKKEFISWTIFTYCKLLSEEIFVPLDTEDKRIEYAPFQLIAQYFLSIGYSGIIYKSTVCKEGKNLVLFDKSYAHPYGNITDVVL